MDLDSKWAQSLWNKYVMYCNRVIFLMWRSLDPMVSSCWRLTGENLQYNLGIDFGFCIFTKDGKRILCECKKWRQMKRIVHSLIIYFICFDVSLLVPYFFEGLMYQKKGHRPVMRDTLKQSLKQKHRNSTSKQIASFKKFTDQNSPWNPKKQNLRTTI